MVKQWNVDREKPLSSCEGAGNFGAAGAKRFCGSGCSKLLYKEALGEGIYDGEISGDCGVSGKSEDD